MPESVKPGDCPFCGGGATEYCFEREDDSRAPRPHRVYRVACDVCEASVERESPDWWSANTPPPETVADGATKAEVLAAWNRRARPPQDVKPVALKPLEWAELGDGVLTCIEWDFRLTEHNGKWGISPLDWPAFDHPYENLGAAKEAAQAAHEKNILSAFVSPPASPPLAIEALREALEAIRVRARNARGAIESNQVVDKDVHGSMNWIMQRVDEALKLLGDSDGR